MSRARLSQQRWAIELSRTGHAGASEVGLGSSIVCIIKEKVLATVACDPSERRRGDEDAREG
jgi:hypothetical protein